MKIKLEVDCDAAEARAFLGLPDVSSLNDHMVSEMRKRLDANMAMLEPQELLKAWTSFGGQAQEQFKALMTAAAGAGLSGRKTGRD